MRIATTAESLMAIGLYLIIMIATVLVLQNSGSIWRWIKRRLSRKAKGNV